MTFIETLFHLAPDAGSGATELAILLLLAGLAVLAAMLRSASPASKSRQASPNIRA